MSDVLGALIVPECAHDAVRIYDPTPLEGAAGELHMEWAIGATITALFGGGVFLFNRLVHHRNLAMQAFADIDVQLKRRADLVPRLVETVRAYAAHEQTTLLAVTELRAQVQAIGTRGTDGERFAAETRLGAALRVYP